MSKQDHIQKATEDAGIAAVERQNEYEAERWYRNSVWRFVAPFIAPVLIGLLIYATY